MRDPHLLALQRGLDNLIKRFQESDLLPNPISTSPEALSEYLQKTDDIELDKSSRLQSLAYKFCDQLSWKQVCEIYERMLEEDEPGEHLGTFATWTTLAEQLVSSPARSDIEREEIFHGLVSITDRALTENPECPAYALLLGMSYFRQFVGEGRKEEYLEQAQIWLDRVIEWADGEDDQDAQTCTYAILYTAHCHAALGEWARALRFYKAVQIPMLTNDEREIAGLHEGIALCEKGLAGN